MTDLKLPTDRSFGLLFTVVFALLAGWLAWKASHVWQWSAALSGAFLLFTLIIPRALHPLNVLWMKFGLLLGKIVSPIVLGVIFYGLFTPVALVMRLAKRDALSRAYDPDAPSYWKGRAPPGPDAGQSFPRQF